MYLFKKNSFWRINDPCRHFTYVRNSNDPTPKAKPSNGEIKITLKKNTATSETEKTGPAPTLISVINNP